MEVKALHRGILDNWAGTTGTCVRPTSRFPFVDWGGREDVTVGVWPELESSQHGLEDLMIGLGNLGMVQASGEGMPGTGVEYVVATPQGQAVLRPLRYPF